MPLEDVLFIAKLPSFSSLKVSIVYVLEANSISIDSLAGSNDHTHVLKLQSNVILLVSTVISSLCASG